MLNELTREYIRRHVDGDVKKLALQAVPHPDIDLPVALDQIRGRQYARKKIPSWAALEEIVYPPHLSMEQCSSEYTAKYKSCLLTRLVSALSPNALQESSGYFLVDLTGGFGIDFAFMTQELQRACGRENVRIPACYVERDAWLCKLAKHNFEILGLRHVDVKNCDSMEFLREMDHVAGLFLDPARRDGHGGRTYNMRDCTPDVLALRDELLAKASFVILKLSPMLDWHQAVKELNNGRPCVSEVHVVSVNNECKELLVVLTDSREDGTTCLRVCCANNGDTFEYQSPQHKEKGAIPVIDTDRMLLPGRFLYEPNASVMKVGCFEELCRRYQVMGVGENSHLYVSEDDSEVGSEPEGIIADFPGRKFQITAVSSMNKKELREKFRQIDQANIATRNFPIKPEELRRRLKLKDGGDTYIFATTLFDGTHVLLLCKSVQI